MIICRPLRQCGQIGSLLKVQLIDRLAEIGQRGAGDAVGIQSIENLVEIKLENAILRVGLLDAKSQNGFADLAIIGPLRAQKKVFRHLLRNGRRTNQPLAGGSVLNVGHQSPGEAFEVQSIVIVKVLVFSRQKRCLDTIGNGLNRKV